MRRTIQAAAAALVAWSAGGALAAKAADLSLPPVYEPEASPIVEFGSGWYLRADANAYDMTYNSNIFGSLGNTNFGATLGVGYQFNSMFRVDLTYDYMTPFTKNKTSYYQGGYSLSGWASAYALNPTYGCPISPDPNNPGNVLTDACTRNTWSKLTTNTFLLNAYLDLAHWYGVTPYIGAGAGLSVDRDAGECDLPLQQWHALRRREQLLRLYRQRRPALLSSRLLEQYRPQGDQLQFRLCVDGRLLLRRLQPAQGGHRLSLPEHGPEHFVAGIPRRRAHHAGRLRPSILPVGALGFVLGVGDPRSDGRRKAAFA